MRIRRPNPWLFYYLARGPGSDTWTAIEGEGGVFGEHFGKTLRAFFTDSSELATEWMWTDDFRAEFEMRRGYDLDADLPVNYVPGRDNKYLSLFMEPRPCFDFEGDLGQRIRHDFERTVSDLFDERFAQAMTHWANANGLQSRIQAYGMRAQTR